jgi:short-subunit dehydrogenase involved in D-alanine esterification of teichoic acids
MLVTPSCSFNVTSGLAFVPLPSVPIYCATKGTNPLFCMLMCELRLFLSFASQANRIPRFCPPVTAHAAAMHSFTISLRQQMVEKGIKVGCAPPQHCIKHHRNLHQTPNAH